MQHYFASICNNKVLLKKDDVHHITHVMRNKVNDKIIIINNNKEYICQIKCFNPLDIEVLEESKVNNELKTDITLFFALAKGDKIDLVIQKACELGVKKIVLVRGERDVVKLTNDDFNRKLVRYNSIIKEACEQSRRQTLVEIEGIYDIKNIPSRLLCETNFVAYEKENNEPVKLVAKNEKSISLLIGSEGGISKEEYECLIKQGFIATSLGKRILRTETAAIYGLSVLGYNLEK